MGIEELSLDHQLGYVLHEGSVLFGHVQLVQLEGSVVEIIGFFAFVAGVGAG